MIIKISKKQSLLYVLWLLVSLISSVLFINTKYFFPSLILFLINISICLIGFILTARNRNIYYFEPILYTIYCILHHFGIMGMYYFSKFNSIDFFNIPIKNEWFLTQVALFYVTFVICILLPNFKYIFFNKIQRLKYNFFKKEFDYKKTTIYLYLSQIILFVLLILMLLFTGHTPINVLNNTNLFRYEYSHGFNYSLFIIFSLFISFHTYITEYFLIVHNKCDKILLTVFIIFYLYWAIISSSRSWFLLPFLYFVYIYVMKNKIKIAISKIISIFFVFLFILYFVAVYRVYRDLNSKQGVEATSKLQNVNVMEETLSRCDYFSNSVKYFAKIKQTYGDLFNYDDFNYTNQIVASFTSYIPRQYLSNKKYLTNGEITGITYGKSVIDNGVIFHFGGICNFFYTGGYCGIILFSLLFGYLIYIINALFMSYYKYSFFQCFYIFAIFPIFINIFTSGILNIQALMLILNILLLFIIQIFITEKR